jgi:hypothetical protein
MLTVKAPSDPLVTRARAVELFVSETIWTYLASNWAIPAESDDDAVSILLRSVSNVGTLVVLKAERFMPPTFTGIGGRPPKQLCVVPLRTTLPALAPTSVNAASNMKEDLMTIVIS